MNGDADEGLPLPHGWKGVRIFDLVPPNSTNEALPFGVLLRVSAAPTCICIISKCWRTSHHDSQAMPYICRSIWPVLQQLGWTGDVSFMGGGEAHTRSQPNCGFPRARAHHDQTRMHMASEAILPHLLPRLQKTLWSLVVVASTKHLPSGLLLIVITQAPTAFPT